MVHNHLTTYRPTPTNSQLQLVMKVTGAHPETFTNNLYNMPRVGQHIDDLMNTESSSTALTVLRVNGKNTLADRPSKLWRLVARLARESVSGGGLVFGGRVRSVCLGDSVAVKIGTPLAAFFGHGGRDTTLQAWTRTGATPTDGAGSGNYASWSAGTYALYDEWSRTPGGLVMHLDASFVGGSTISAPASAQDRQVSHSVRVHFLSGNNTGAGDSSYGLFRLQYQINKTGSWLNAPIVGVVRAANTPTGYVTTGNHFTGATTIAVTGGTVPIPTGSTIVFGSVEYTVTTGVTGAGNIVISPALASTVTSGAAIQPTEVNTNSGVAERYASATFNLPSLDVYNIRIVATSGRVRLCKVISDAGAFGGGASGQGTLSGACEVGFDQGGKSLAAHFINTTDQVMNDALGLIDPHVVVFKSANAYTLGNYQTHWPTYATRVMAAAPNSLFVVCGSHPQNAFPSTADEGYVAVDDYLREWCANTQGAIFIDVRQSFPEYATDNSLDDLWSDGIHIYGGSSGNWGGGDWWITSRVWEALRPAFETYRLGRSGFNWSAVMPFFVNELRMYDNNSLESSRSNRFAFISKPRMPSSVVIRPTTAFYNGGFQTFSSESGFGAAASDDTSSPNALYLISDGNTVMTFGRHVSLGSGYLGCFIGNSAGLARAKNGCRILAPPQNYGLNPALVAEGVVGQLANSRIFGVDREASNVAAGIPIWSWMPDGSVIYEGGPGSGGVGTVTRTGNAVSSIAVTNPGHSYLVAPTVTITGGGGSGATATAVVSGGRITAFNVTAGGTGYTSDPTVVLTPNSALDDANELFFTYESPTADVTLHTPICATAGTGGAHTRVMVNVPSYPTQAAGNLAVGVAESFYAEDVKKVFTRLS